MRIFTLIIVSLYCLGCNLFNHDRTLNFWIDSPPYSADPIEYDFFNHHIVYRSVLSSLTTKYGGNEVKGVLVKSWLNEDNHKKWTFTLRNDVYFSNGERITAKIIYQSLKRIAYLLKQKESQDGFTTDLEGIEQLTSMASEFEGLKYTEDTLTFIFSSPQPKLLDELSFGLYSIVHPDNYSLKTGKWNSPFDVIASGAYEILEMDGNSITLGLNQKFPQSLGHENKFEKVNIRWGGDKEGADIFAGTSMDIINNKEFHFSGGVESGIAFMRCHSWNDKESPLYDIEYRRSLRNSLILKLKKTGFPFTTSFFPRGLEGLQSYKFPLLETKHKSREKLSFRNFTNRNFKFWDNVNSFFTSLPSIEFRNDLHLKEVFADLARNDGKYSVDIASIVTSILIEEPEDDVVFMIKSKAGIQLPDINGKLTQYAEERPIDPNKINQEIWNQAVIWPIAHFSRGLYYKPFIDLELLSISQPPIDFNWIGRK